MIIILILLLLIFIYSIGAGPDRFAILRIDREHWFPRELALGFVMALKQPINDEYIKMLENTYGVNENAIENVKIYAKLYGDYYDFIQKESPEMMHIEKFRIAPLEEKLKYPNILKFYTGFYTKYSPKITTDINMLTTPINYNPIGGLEFINYKFDTRTLPLLKEAFNNAGKYGFLRMPIAAGVEHLSVFDHTNKKYSKKIDAYISQIEHHDILNKIPKFKPLYNTVMQFVNAYILTIPNCVNVQISYVRHVSNLGLRSHMDSVAGQDLPIIVANFGTDIYYDMFPILRTGTTGYRILIKDGEVIKMSESARYEWSHGIPNNIPNMDHRYAILFKLRSAETEIKEIN